MEGVDEALAYFAERMDYCSDSGPNEAMRRHVELLQTKDDVARLVAAVTSTLQAIYDNPDHPMTASQATLSLAIIRFQER
jgi:hypothetical protein